MLFDVYCCMLFDVCSPKDNFLFFFQVFVVRRMFGSVDETTTPTGIIHEIVCRFTDEMYRQHFAAVGLFLAGEGATKKKR